MCVFLTVACRLWLTSHSDEGTTLHNTLCVCVCVCVYVCSLDEVKEPESAATFMCWGGGALSVTGGLGQCRISSKWNSSQRVRDSGASGSELIFDGSWFCCMWPFVFSYLTTSLILHKLQINLKYQPNPVIRLILSSLWSIQIHWTPEIPSFLILLVVWRQAD